ncbi:MAG: 3-phosphoshikimate 1-carboxyvinyltransferase [Acidimicrobiales bacterium]
MRVRISGGVGTANGVVVPPGDKSISHRALLFASIANGTSQISNLSDGADVGATRRAIGLLGASVTTTTAPRGQLSTEEGSTHVSADQWVTVEGCGLDGLHEPAGIIDVGNSGTLLRLLPGLLAGIDGAAVLSGDASVNERPVDRIIRPLTQMGASFDARRRGTVPPMWIRGGALRGIHYRTPVPSAQIKSAVLLAGLFAEGETVLSESTETRPHTEEFFSLCEVPFDQSIDADGSRHVRITRPDRVAPFFLTVPADPSQAAFWAVAAAISPKGAVTLRTCYRGTSRAGYLDVLSAMGADVSRVPLGGEELGLPREDVSVRWGPLRGVTFGGAFVSTMIDEIPILAVAACFAEGTSEFRDIGELRVKESDRIASTAAMLEAFGASVRTEADALIVSGSPEFVPSGALIDAHGDHRIAMAAAIMASRSPHEAIISGFESVATSYVRFGADYERLIGKEIESVPGESGAL